MKNDIKKEYRRPVIRSLKAIQDVIAESSVLSAKYERQNPDLGNVHHVDVISLPVSNDRGSVTSTGGLLHCNKANSSYHRNNALDRHIAAWGSKLADMLNVDRMIGLIL